MALTRVLVTGGQGFLGTYILRDLLKRGSEVALLDLKEDFGILEQVLAEGDLDRITKFFVDITNTSTVQDAVLSFKPTAIIHLAGLQIPTCRANPVLGASVNVLGTVNVFEAVRALATEQGADPVPVAYASSGAALGPSSDYANEADIPATKHNHMPRTIYGVYKLCNEGTARIFWQDHKVPSLGLRPLTIFGVGRELGVTSGPTKAVKAAVLGRPYVIEVTGRTGFHYVADVARFFIDGVAGAQQTPGAHVCGIKGHLVTCEDFLAAAAQALPEVKELASIKPGAPDVPIHGDVDEEPLKTLTGCNDLHMPLADAINDMVSLFKDLKTHDRLHDRDL